MPVPAPGDRGASTGLRGAHFCDVTLEPGRETILKLKTAKAARFRLVTGRDRPVPGDKVRFFNRGSIEGLGGYPMAGLQGTVWATSNVAGEVVLDSLQTIDPDDPKSGNSVYWFYVEPSGLAPLMIGPVQSGQDLGKIAVGPFLEVRGEIRGTQAELNAFHAEWDQPLTLKHGHGKSDWDYIVSKSLKTERQDDKLVFHLTGLTPGNCTSSRFKKGGKAISHTFGERHHDRG